MAPHREFKYSQLKRPNSFRLLRLQEDEVETHPLRCVIEHHILPDNNDDKHNNNGNGSGSSSSNNNNQNRCPEYAAISYCWGDPRNTETITVNGAKLSVTVNLAAALRQLRKDDQADEQYLWADALCINQDDVREKTRQIGLMPRIYAGATKVITWLSQEDRDADHLAYLSAVLLKNPKHRSEQTAFQRALNAINSKNYWSRIWIVQELSLAKDIEVACKNQRVPWWKFVQVSCGHMGLPLSPGSIGSTHAILSDSRILELDAIRQDIQNKVPIPTLRALYRTRACQSTVKADRIFALLGLTSDGHLKIGRLKYEDQIAITILNLSLTEMEETGRLDLITFPGGGNSASYVYRTWIPNWINRALWRRLRVWQFSQVLQSHDEFFRATKPAGRTKFDFKKAELKIWGRSLGTVCPRDQPARLRYRNSSCIAAAADSLISEFPDLQGNGSFDWPVRSSAFGLGGSGDDDDDDDNNLRRNHSSGGGGGGVGLGFGRLHRRSSSRTEDGILLADSSSSRSMLVRATGATTYRSRLQGLVDFLEPLALRRRVSSNDWLVFQDSAGEGEADDDPAAAVAAAVAAAANVGSESPGTRAWVKRDPARFRANDERYADELRGLLYLGSSRAQDHNSRNNSSSGNSGGGSSGGAGIAASGSSGVGDLCIGDMCFVGTSGGVIGLGPVAAKPGDSVYLVDGCSVPVVLRERQADSGGSRSGGGAAGVFEVIGECLVLGLMKGECFEKRKGPVGLLGPTFKMSNKEMLTLV